MYIARPLEETVVRLAGMFGAILVTGPRQVGKTIMLKTMTNGIPYITLDDPILMQTAVEEVGSFFKSTPPVFVDEIQYAPNLFPYIKMIIDAEKKKGQFYLSGSQHFRMMKNVAVCRKLYADENLDWQSFYAVYTKTYVERDVRDLTQQSDIGNLPNYAV